MLKDTYPQVGFRRLSSVADPVCMSRGVVSGKGVHGINQTLRETQIPKKSKYSQTNILNINTSRVSSED